MPGRAFVPAPLLEVQPRVYRSFRGRQLRGLLASLIGAGITIWFAGLGTFSGYILTFCAALPGFAYGYYQVQGKPVEYWLRVLFRYYLRSQSISAYRPLSPLARAGNRIRRAWRAAFSLIEQQKKSKGGTRNG